MTDTLDRISINTVSLEPAPLDQLVREVADFGLTHIGVTIDDIDSVGSDAAAATLRQGGLAAALVTHHAFAFATPDLAREGRDRLNRTIDAAQTVASPAICMTTGGRRHLAWDEAAARFADEVQPCVARAAEAGVDLCLEPTTHLLADFSIAHRLSDVVKLAGMAGLKIGIDLYPCWVDADIDDAIDAATPITRFVQISDYTYGDRTIPGRSVLGEGVVPLDRLVDQILAAGFDGVFDIEVMGPRFDGPDRDEKLRRCIEVVQRLLERPRSSPAVS